jgi:S1-C subfamily serine protease
MEEPMTDTTQSGLQFAPEAVAAQLSAHLSALIAAAAHSVIAIHASPRRASSGLIWEPGIAVGAEEAVEQHSDLSLTLPDGRRAAARLAGRDPSTDIVVLRFDDTVGATRPMGTSPLARDLRPGHLAVTIGRHGGDVVAAQGMIALSGPPWRSREGGLIDARLRIDARLPAAAEGGAIVAHDGSLIGMAVFGPRRQVLAIPAVTIARIVQSIKDKGDVVRGYLGVGLQSVPVPGQAEGAPRRAAMVATLDPAGPAQAAGILQGDIILAVGGAEVTGLRSVYRQLGPDAVGETKVVDLIRAGARTSVEVTVAGRPRA